MHKEIAITVDLDGEQYYRKIHGEISENDADVLYEGPAFQRMLDLFLQYNVKATLFVIADDVLRYRTLKENLLSAVELGHEIASHSASHDYGLTKQASSKIFEEVVRSKQILEEELGIQVHGFRAPGYNTSPQVFNALLESGYTYDSSLFSSLPYYFVRRLVLYLYRVIGRKSSSLMGDWRAFGKPGQIPYRIGEQNTQKYWHGLEDVNQARSLREFPIRADMGLFGIPLIGTNIVSWPSWLIRYMCRSQLRQSGLWTVEFHLIDFSGAEDFGLSELGQLQFDAQVPWDDKVHRLSDFFLMLQGYEKKTLGEWNKTLKTKSN